jgi:hypothetical protein
MRSYSLQNSAENPELKTPRSKIGESQRKETSIFIFAHLTLRQVGATSAKPDRTCVEKIRLGTRFGLQGIRLLSIY